jgi:hypothetical protein
MISIARRDCSTKRIVACNRSIWRPSSPVRRRSSGICAMMKYFDAVVGVKSSLTTSMQDAMWAALGSPDHTLTSLTTACLLKSQQIGVERFLIELV